MILHATELMCPHAQACVLGLTTSERVAYSQLRVCRQDKRALGRHLLAGSRDVAADHPRTPALSLTLAAVMYGMPACRCCMSGAKGGIVQCCLLWCPTIQLMKTVFTCRDSETSVKASDP